MTSYSLWHFMRKPLHKPGAHKPLYNTVHYNTVLDIIWFKDGSQNVKTI